MILKFSAILYTGDVYEISLAGFIMFFPLCCAFLDYRGLWFCSVTGEQNGCDLQKRHADFGPSDRRSCRYSEQDSMLQCRKGSPIYGKFLFVAKSA